MGHQYIQIPPDSTGKQILNRVHVEISYENGTVDFELGKNVTGLGSGTFGIVTKITGSQASGMIMITLNASSSVAFTGGENLQVRGVTYATMVGGSQTSYYVPFNMIAGYPNMTPANVDFSGSLQVGFGEHELDAFGRLNIAEATSLGDYSYSYDKLPNLISEETSGSGTGTLDTDGHFINMEVTNSNGDVIIRTTDIYHFFSLGQAQTCQTALWLGDTGKANNRRRWGYFDEKDGAFFELEETILNVVVRSNATGSILENRIPQSEWNYDTMDGDNDAENPSGLTLDITKSIIYWIDFSHPADAVRFGIYYDNKKVIVHEIQHGNNAPYPMVGHIQLPLRWENRNFGATSGDSNMYQIAGTVKTNGKFEPFSLPIADSSNYQTISTSASYVPLFSGRMKETFKGQDNRVINVPKTVAVYNNGSVPVVIEMILDGTLVGATWADDLGAGVATVQDRSATGVSGGLSTGEFVVAPNTQQTWTFPFSLSTPTGKLFRKADITATPLHMTIAARLLNGETGSTDVIAFMNWIEF